MNAALLVADYLLDSVGMNKSAIIKAVKKRIDCKKTISYGVLVLKKGEQPPKRIPGADPVYVVVLP